MNVQQLVGQRVRAVREALGMTQEQLGDGLEPLLGRAWPRQAVSGAEAGGRAFTATELMALAHVLGVNSALLLTPPQEGQEVEMPTGVSLVLRQSKFTPAQLKTLTATWDAIQAIAESEQSRQVREAESGTRNLQTIMQLTEQLLTHVSDLVPINMEDNDAAG